MNILKKMEQVDEKFNNIQDAMKQKTDGYNKEMRMYSDELKMLQGEYRLLFEMGKESGVLDPVTGAPIQEVPIMVPEPQENLATLVEPEGK